MSLPAITVKSYIQLTGILILACLSHQTPQTGRNKCGTFEWYDDNVYSCAPCSELCDQRNVTRTERECKAWCKDYLTAKTCTDEQYYDIHMESCGPCSELCSASSITRTTDECRDNCKAYLNKTQAPSNSNVDTIAVSAGNAKAFTGDQRKASKVTVTIIVVAVIGTCACGSAIAVVVARRKGACRRRGGHGPDYQRASNQNMEILPLSVAIQESDPQLSQSGRLIGD